MSIYSNNFFTISSLYEQLQGKERFLIDHSRELRQIGNSIIKSGEKIPQKKEDIFPFLQDFESSSKELFDQKGRSASPLL